MKWNHFLSAIWLNLQNSAADVRNPQHQKSTGPAQDLPATFHSRISNTLIHTHQKHAKPPPITTPPTQTRDRHPTQHPPRHLPATPAIKHHQQHPKILQPYRRHRRHPIGATLHPNPRSSATNRHRQQQPKQHPPRISTTPSSHIRDQTPAETSQTTPSATPSQWHPRWRPRKPRNSAITHS